MKHTLKIGSVGLLALAALVMVGGCQSQQHVFLTEQRIETIEREAGMEPAARRVHILLADYAGSSGQVSPLVELGAGDALGRQVFHRYATIVWNRMEQRSTPIIVQAEDEPTNRDSAM